MVVAMLVKVLIPICSNICEKGFRATSIIQLNEGPALRGSKRAGHCAQTFIQISHKHFDKYKMKILTNNSTQPYSDQRELATVATVSTKGGKFEEVAN